MTREEKRQIRIQIHSLVESECKGCDYHHILKSHEYCHKECPVGQLLKSLSERLEQNKRIPAEKDRGENTELKSGSWTNEEEMYLLNHAPYFRIVHIAMRLNRAPKNVSIKLHSLKKKQKQTVC